MFSKDINVIIKTTRLEEGFIIYSEHYNLPQRKVLFLTKNEDRKKTIIKVFSNDNLADCLVERTINGEYHLLCIFPDGCFLMEQDGRTNSLIKICHKTLDTLSNQPWKLTFTAGVIDNEHFFSIKQNKDLRNQRVDYSFLIYKWNENCYEISSNIKLTALLKSPSGYIESIQTISNKRYCCILRGHNTDEFRILIFGIDLIANEVKEHGIIQPKVQECGSSSPASGSVAVLPNNQIVTYHACHDNVQIWDTKTLECVKEWNWADTKTPKEFFVWCLKIIPFPDSTHFLIHKGDNLYLFNKNKLSMIPVKTSTKFQGYGNHHILSNGQIVAITPSRNFHNNSINLMHLVLSPIIHCQKIITESQHLVRLFFNRTRLPIEITDQIFKYAFTPESKELLTKKAIDSLDKQENEQCLIM